MDKVICNVCKKSYSKKGIGTHMWRTHGNGKKHEPNTLRAENDYTLHCQYCDQEINYRNIKKHTNTCLQNPKNHRHCEQCNQILISVDQKRFCNHSCAAIHSNLHVPRKRRGPIPTSIREKQKARQKLMTDVEWLICEDTGKYYCNRNNKGNKRWRSPYIDNTKTKLSVYRRRCNFDFSVKSYPDEFELDLIVNYGWYKPTNKGNNLAGVSRDHMYSVKDGFDNNIDSTLISHPANCQLLQHSDNVRKYTNSKITLIELKERINIWNEKYV